MMALFYLMGNGVEENVEKAIELYTLSANAGNLKSQYFLGVFHAQGQYSLKKDIEKAIEMFTLSAHGGCPDAQFELGERYANGENVEQNMEKAIEYYRMAAELGCVDSQEIIKAHESM